MQCFMDSKLSTAALLSPMLAAVLVQEGHLAALVYAAQASLQISQQERRVAPPGMVLAQLVEEAELAAGAAAEAGAPAAGHAAELAGTAAALEQLCAGAVQLDVSTLLPPARRLAAALLAWWRRPEAPPAAALEAVQAAAARSCAYLRCANLGGEGGPAAGPGGGSQRCR